MPKIILKHKDPLSQTILEKQKDPCWKGYRQIGTKKKGDKTVPNCVPVKEEKTEEIRYCPKCKKNETRKECRYGVKYWDKYATEPKIKESISFEIGSGHREAKKQAKIRNLTKTSNENEKRAAEKKLKGPKLPMEEVSLEETMRIQSKSGNLMSVILSWRGRYYQLQMFFPTLRIPSRKEVEFEIQKIYPDSKLMHHRLSSLDPNKPIVHSNVR